MLCVRCAMEGEAHVDNPHLCVGCVDLEDKRVAHMKQLTYNWLEVAKEAERELWERQPNETDHEYNVWLHYRDMYPSKRPSYKDVAVELSISVNAVRKISSRWSFPARLQAWGKHVDEMLLAERSKQIRSMNEKHVSMANTVNEKLRIALEALQPTALSPREIVSLMKLSTELERKALGADIESFKLPVGDDDNPDISRGAVKTESIQEVMDILAKAGVVTNFGVRQTVTTEVVVKDE